METLDEMEMVSTFLQYLQDYGDILSDLDVSESVKAGFHLTQELKELEKMSFLVFGERRVEKLKMGGYFGDWEVAIIILLREGNSALINLSEQEKVPENNEV